MAYRHYSFDMWGTLLQPNPEFTGKRVEYFYTKMLKSGIIISLHDISQILNDIGKLYDALSLMNGKSPDAIEMYAHAIFRMQGNLKDITPLAMEIVYKEIESIFLENPPLLYPDTKSVLDELKLRAKTLSILSNTAYIRGNTLDKVLDMYDIKSHFMIRCYSDQYDLSKPNPAFFNVVHRQLPYSKESILHVGDNEVLDFRGATEFGWNGILINSNRLTIKDLL